MKKVYIELEDGAYRGAFTSMGYQTTGILEDADLICFTGGSDVTPRIYGDKQHPQTYNDVQRDEKCQRLFHAALGLDKPMVGICRGAQFLNVMSGGRMYQHVEKHGRSHYITDLQTGETIYVTSTHHQMMMPSSQAHIIAVAALGGQREWYTGEVAKRDISDMDHEVCFYKHTKALCFQPHPEIYQEGAEYAGMRAYFQQLLNKYLMV